MILTIPAPAPWVSANRRGHWAKTSRHMRAWRDAAHLHARALTPMPVYTEPVVITAVVHRTTRRIADPANLLGGSVKAAIDGLVDAGVLPGDDPRYVAETRIRAGEVREPAQLVLHVEAAS